MSEAKRGDRISLNVLKRLFYFQDGEGGINLAAGQNEVTVIPQNATDQHLEQINHAIKAEQLTIGWPEKQQSDLSDKDSDLRALLEGGRNKINSWISDLKDDKATNSKYKTFTIERLVKFEKAGKNRQSVLKCAEDALAALGGVSMIEESEQEKVEIKLTSGNEIVPEDK
jgi:hypothetical protein